MKLLLAACLVTSLCVAFGAALGVADLKNYDDDAAVGSGSSTSPKNAANRSQAPVLTIVHDLKTPLVFLLALGGAVLPAVLAFRENARYRRHKRRLVERYLQHVHERSFPHRGAAQGERDEGMGLEYRVSLFVPKRAGLWDSRKVLHCQHRTDLLPAKRTWPLYQEKGLVTRAWRLRTVAVASPPKDNDPESLTKYLANSWMDAQDRKDRSWPNAGMRAEPIIVHSTSDPIAILLVEGRERPIDVKDLQWDAKTLAMLLEDL